MKARWVSWKHLKAGDLFQSRDDLYPLRVLSSHSWGVVVNQGWRFWNVYFRRRAKVLLFADR